ncbi:thioesterase [Affinibrenneria salicis]|uniref:Thioesterase n=1 Tax=Affinibrenneria salicis TaxID=2590031 RepID=A0A5J5FU16_9GAMM|nr:alpha/beta fold hydrolase [Affinibrenneria salicis]KAA8996663.1 thioesterase [Affinibrenneria salicis]
MHIDLYPIITSPWLRRYQSRPIAAVRLICLPHAGGAASFFRDWGEALPDDIDVISVQYPGREERIDEPLVGCMSELIYALTQEIRGLLDRPYVLLGHSMGGIVAYELCQAMSRIGLRLPEHLIVSACEAPVHHQGGSLHIADDPTLCETLSRLGGTSSALFSSPELRALLLPVIRNDYCLIEQYRPAPVISPLPVPVSAFIGREDHELTREQACDWRMYGASGFDLKIFSGGHFYLRQQMSSVISVLTAIFDDVKAHYALM